MGVGKKGPDLEEGMIGLTPHPFSVLYSREIRRLPPLNGPQVPRAAQLVSCAPLRSEGPGAAGLMEGICRGDLVPSRKLQGFSADI